MSERPSAYYYRRLAAFLGLAAFACLMMIVWTFPTYWIRWSITTFILLVIASFVASLADNYDDR